MHQVAQFFASVYDTTHAQFHIWRNLALAVSPLLLSLLIFRVPKIPNAVRWLLVPVFIAFLPNAAYVLTDIIHLVYEIRRTTLSMWQIVGGVIPLYVMYMAVGFQAYVLSLTNVGYYLKQIGRANFILPAELGLNLLCALAVFLGRCQRLDSWYIVTNPSSVEHDALRDVTHWLPLIDISSVLVFTTGLYFCAKTINCALVEHFERSRIQRAAQYEIAD